MKLNRIIAGALSCALIIASCGTKEEITPTPTPKPDSDPDPVVPVDPPVDEPYSGIKTYADLKAFADSVNLDHSIERFCNKDGEVVLLNDIDMSAMDEDVWLPIGDPETISNENTACKYTGPAFKGVFNGQGHAILNFKANLDLNAGVTYGLFGVLDGATVKNLVLGAASGDKSLFTVKADATADVGILAGTATGATSIEECVNYIPMKVLGNKTGARLSCGSFVGYACSNDKAVSLVKLVNNGTIEMTSGSNTNNGATGVMVGGIVGFCTGSDTAITMIENCENKANISGDSGRSSGIAATMNTKTMMRYCINRGNITNDFVNGRVGNLSCIMGNNCTMDDCTNYGDCITSDASTTTAGMVALLNGDSAVITGGGNYGTIIGANEKYHGLLVANFSKFSSVKGVYVGGACGTFAGDGNHKMHELNADNWIKHIGSYSDANFVKITELSSPWGNGGAEEGALPEFKDASLRILFIGNSFTMDAVTHLPGICKAASATDITMAHCYYGGRTIPEYYSDRELANNTLYFTNPGDAKFTQWGAKASIKAVAESGRWDVVTIQEHTGNFRAWSWTAEEKKAVQDLVDYVCATQSVKPKVFYIMSQAYFDMGKIGSASKPYVTWGDSQDGMYKVIVDQTKKVLAETTVDDVIATGTMLQNLRTSKLDNDDNLTRDGYHMDYGISRYGAACTVFEKIVTPATGKTLEGNSFRFSGSEAGTTNVTDANAPIAQKAAHYAVEKPFEVTSMAEEEGGDDIGDVTLKGKGTAEEPYLISVGSDMKQISTTLAEGETKYFEMTSDIDMSAITDWAPVNEENKAKTINFDGKGHKISGFTCTGKNYASLFGLVSGSIKNLVVEKPVVTNSAQLGVIAVWLGNNKGSLKAEISNVHIIDGTLNMTGTGTAAAGMIAANLGGSTIKNCSASGTITHGCTSSSWTYVGGLAGRAYATGCEISCCSFNGEIKATKGFGFGGILGGSGSDVAVKINNCWSSGSMSGVSYAGGIVADLCKGSDVKSCYSTMSISGIYNLAGIVARASNAKNPNSDGTFDTSSDITVSGCIAWSPSIKSTSKTESTTNHYSSGAVVGFTVYRNTLKDCWRRPDMDFHIYKDAEDENNTLNDTADTDASNPLVKPGTNPYLCPFNGKAAPSGSTVASLAKTLGWSDSIWDLSTDCPTLK